MIRAEFYQLEGRFSGFRLSGHAGLAVSGEDVACAAVSSAVQLTVNLLFEFGCEPEASSDDGTVKCSATENAETASKIMKQLKLHLEAILEEFPKTIKITISEV